MVIRKFVHYIISSKYHGCSGPAETVRLLQFGQTSFSHGEKNKSFYKKQVTKKSASVVFGLVRLILLGGGGIWKGAR